MTELDDDVQCKTNMSRDASPSEMNLDDARCAIRADIDVQCATEGDNARCATKMNKN